MQNEMKFKYLCCIPLTSSEKSSNDGVEQMLMIPERNCNVKFVKPTIFTQMYVYVCVCVCECNINFVINKYLDIFVEWSAMKALISAVDVN
jgi:hypothetical protein